MDIIGTDMFEISACGKGTYGLNCNTSCNNCLSKTCDNVEGLCTIKDTCKPGYLGSKCDQGILLFKLLLLFATYEFVLYYY